MEQKPPPELLPCWCRDENEWLRVEQRINHGDFACKPHGFYVYCPNCWTCGPTCSIDRDAREGWNKSRVRAPLATKAIDAAIAAVVAAERERAIEMFSDWLNEADQSVADLYAAIREAAKESEDGRN
jgi:hypothetical protein